MTLNEVVKDLKATARANGGNEIYLVVIAADGSTIMRPVLELPKNMEAGTYQVSVVKKTEEGQEEIYKASLEIEDEEKDKFSNVQEIPVSVGASGDISAFLNYMQQKDAVFMRSIETMTAEHSKQIAKLVEDIQRTHAEKSDLLKENHKFLMSEVKDMSKEMRDVIKDSAPVVTGSIEHESGAVLKEAAAGLMNKLPDMLVMCLEILREMKSLRRGGDAGV